MIRIGPIRPISALPARLAERAAERRGPRRVRDLAHRPRRRRRAVQPQLARRRAPRSTARRAPGRRSRPTSGPSASAHATTTHQCGMPDGEVPGAVDRIDGPGDAGLATRGRSCPPRRSARRRGNARQQRLGDEALDPLVGLGDDVVRAALRAHRADVGAKRRAAPGARPRPRRSRRASGEGHPPAHPTAGRNRRDAAARSTLSSDDHAGLDHRRRRGRRRDARRAARLPRRLARARRLPRRRLGRRRAWAR